MTFDQGGHVRKIFEGGTVVTAEGSFRADVAVDGRDDRGGRASTCRATAPRSIDVSGAR